MARKNRRKTRATADAAATWRGWWDSLSGRTQHIICVLLLLVVSFGFFAPVHFSGKSLIGGDAVQWRGMAQAMLEYHNETGERPLWAPNAFAGMPGYMIEYPEYIPQFDDITHWLRGFIWPSSHFVFLLLGTYLLIFFLTRNKLAGVLGAVAYGLTTYIPIILVAGHNSKFIALSFAPWLVLAFAYTLRRPRLLGGLLFAAAFALNLRANHPQITYYVVFMLGVWWIVEAVAAVREKRTAAFSKATGWLALGAVLGLCMVAQPYLPHYEYKEYTIRGAATDGGEGGLDYSYAMSWSQGVGELVTLLIPGAYGGGAPLYWGPKPFTSGPHYIGGIVFLLAMLALWGVRRYAVWGPGAATLLMVLFSLGEHLQWLNAFMFEYFPFFDAFRVPETWLAVVALSMALLAGYGACYLARSERSAEAEQRKSKAIYATAGGLIGIVLLLLVAKGAFFDFERPDEDRQIAQQLVQQIQQQRPDLSINDPQVQQLIRQQVGQELARREELRAELFTEDAVRTLIFLVLAGLVLVAYRRDKVPGWVAVAVLALLVTIDLWRVDRQYFNESHLVQGKSTSSQIAKYPFDDYLIEQRQEAGGAGHFRVLSFASGNPMTSSRASYYHESLGGYHGAKLRLYQDFLDHLFDQETGLPNEQLLDLMNTRYVVARGQLPGLEVVYRDPQGFVVMRNPDALPRAFFVGETEVVPSKEETFDRLQSEDFDLRQTALLRQPIEGFETTPIDSASTATAELQHYDAQEIVWNVRTDAPRLLVVSEVYYPAGWKATLDGAPVPIYRADHLLRAVPVPAGEHTLVMRFEPRSHTLGVWIAGLSTFVVYGGVLFLLGLNWYRRRTRPGEPVREEEEASVGS